MPAVDLQALNVAIQQLRQAKAKVSEELPAVGDLRRANRRLESENRELKEKLAKQGQAYANLKQAWQNSEQM